MIGDARVGRRRARHVATGSLVIAAAARLRLPLVTWGLEQREHATGISDVFVPES